MIGDVEKPGRTSRAEQESKAHKLFAVLIYYGSGPRMRWTSWGAEGRLALHNCWSWQRLSSERSRSLDAGVHTCFQHKHPHQAADPLLITLSARFDEISADGCDLIQNLTSGYHNYILSLLNVQIQLRFSYVLSGEAPLGTSQGPLKGARFKNNHFDRTSKPIPGRPWRVLIILSVMLP